MKDKRPIIESDLHNSKQRTEIDRALGARPGGGAELGGPPTGRELRIRRSGAVSYWVLFGVVAVLVAVAVGAHIRSEYRKTIREWDEQLSSVADDRATMVSNWLDERRADAITFASRPLVVALLSESHKISVAGELSPQGLLVHLDQVVKAYGYTAIYIFDRNGKLVLASTGAPAMVSSAKDAYQSIARSGECQVRLSGDSPTTSYISFTAPVLPWKGLLPPASPTAPPLGAVTFLTDSSQKLFPILTAMSVPTRTGETFLAYRNANELVYFTPLRKLPAGAASLHPSYDLAMLPPRAAIEGHQVFGEFIDYRGDRVLAATRRIPQTSWGLVNKIDRTEALEDFRRMAWFEGAAGVLLVAAFGGLLLAHLRYALSGVLQAEGEKFRDLLESAPDAMVIVSPSGQIARVNAQAEKLFGYGRNELLGRPLMMLVPERCRVERAEFYARYFSDPAQQPSRAEEERLGLRKDGSEFPAQITRSPILASEGAVVAIAVRDSTERKRAEKELLQANAYNRSLIESSLDPLVTIAPEGKITDVNSATERVTGRPRSELTGTDFCDYFTDPARARAGYLQVFSEGHVHDYELEIRHRDGHLTPVLYNASVYRSEEGEVTGVVAAARDITERKRNEEALKRNAASLAQAQATANLGSWEADVATGSAVWSAEMFCLTGFDPSLGTPPYARFLEFVHPEDRNALQETDARVVKSGQAATIEFRSNPGRGPVRTFLGKVEPVIDAQGRVVRLSGILQDISERKRAEQTLRESEIKYRTLVENIPQKIFMKSRDYRWVSINENFARELGVRPDEVIGKTDYDLYPKELADKYRADDKRIMESGITEDFDEEYMLGGERRVVHTVKAPVREKDETISGVLGVFWDVTDRRRIEKALQDSEEQIHLLLDSAAEGIYGLDQAGMVTLCNRSCLELLGFQKSEDLMGKSMHALCHHTRPDGSPYPIEECRAHSAVHNGQGAHVDDEIYWRADGTSFPAEYWSYPIRKDGKVVGCVVTFLDITLRRKAESDLRTLNQELEQRVTQRTAELEVANKELEAFTYSVSHDLRAPLRHIDGFSKMLMEEDLAGLSDDSKRYLSRIREGTRQMGQLVDDLLTMARLGRKELALQVTGLTSLVQEAAEEVKRENKDREIEWQIDALPFVECDPGLIKQVFVNLLSNAAKYSRPRAQAKIHVGAIQQDGQSVIFVCDNGVGFSMKYADKLFGVFQRLHRAEDFEGTGIGLATVQRILHKHGGRAWAEAELDKGATFYFTLGSGISDLGKQKLDGGEKAA